MVEHRRLIPGVVIVVVSQLGLITFAGWLCTLQTQFKWSEYHGVWVNDSSYTGYPIPWREDVRRAGKPAGFDAGPLLLTLPAEAYSGPERVGMNPTVLLAALVLAFSLPPSAAALARWVRGRPGSRSARLTGSLAVATLFTLAVSLLDVLTAPGDSVKGVPVSRPGTTLGLGYSGRGRSELDWLTRKRAELWHENDGLITEPDVAGQEWAHRFWRSNAAMAGGLLTGCLIFRPWRRAGGPSASDGAAATTPPSARPSPRPE